MLTEQKVYRSLKFEEIILINDSSFITITKSLIEPYLITILSLIIKDLILCKVVIFTKEQGKKPLAIFTLYLKITNLLFRNNMFCCTSILLYILTPLIIIYLYYKWIFNHWKRQNVPYPHPKIPFGNFNNPLNRSRAMFEVVGDVYKEFKAKNQKHCGVYLFAKPIYLPIDTDILRNIFTVDFNHFTDRGIYVNEHSDPLSANLFGLGGQKWRNLRVKFTPTFTSGKMKLMYNVMEDSARNMIKFIDEYV